MSACADFVSAGTIPARIFVELREEIVSGQLPTGSKISEPELARRYDVSRGALREALGRLETCGLLVRRANVGARVVTLSSEQLIEIYHIREALEGMAARLAATAMNDDEVSELRELLARHGREIENDAGHAYFQQEGDLDFHFRIVLGSHNNRLIDLLCRDLYHLVRVYRRQFGMPSKRGPQAFIEHGHIVNAIARHDPEMAELMMRAHIRASRENAERLLREHQG